MRTSTILVAFLLAATASAQFAQITEAIKGFSTLSTGVTNIANVASNLLPSGLLLPMAAVAPLKQSLPVLLGLKALGLMKYKLMLAKIPFLAPVGVATAKFGLLKAKYMVGKAALKASGKATLSAIHLPVKLTAAKIGAISGAISGSKAGLAAYKVHSKKASMASLLVPANTLLEQSKSLAGKFRAPMKTVTVEVKHVPVYVEPAYTPAAPEAPAYAPKSPAYGPETAAYDAETPAYPTEAPAYAAETPAYEAPAYPTEAPAYTEAPTYTEAPVYTEAPPVYTEAPVYTPAPAAYRKRRSVPTEASADEELFPSEALSSIFEYIRKLDNDRCVHRLICELSVQPSLAGNEFSDVTDFINDLPNADASAPWMTYKNAAAAGAASGDRQMCASTYSECQRSTDVLIETARKRLAGVDF